MLVAIRGYLEKTRPDTETEGQSKKKSRWRMKVKDKEFQDVRERQNGKWKGISAYSSFQSLSHV